MTQVKICGLCNVDDARQAWQLGADLLGFIFVPSSPRYVKPDVAANIAARLREEGCGARLVGVFVNQDAASVRAITAQCLLDHVQLNGDESPEYVQQLGLSTIVGRRVCERIPWDELNAYPAWAYLFDTAVSGQYGGTGRTWPWHLLAGHTANRVLIAGGLTPANVRDAVRMARPWGVDVASGVEAYPGQKDPQKVAALIRRVREEDDHDQAD